MTSKGWYATLSSEQKAKIREAKRLKYSSVSNDKKLKRSEKRRKDHQKMLASFSLEQLAAYREKIRDGWIKYDKSLTTEQQALLRNSRYASNRRWWQSLSPEAKQRQLDAMKLRKKNLLPEEKEKERQRIKAIQATPKHIISQRLYGKQFREQRKQLVISHYSNNTMHCMNTDCEVSGGAKNIDSLCIDHINGGGHKHTRELGGYNFYNWLIKNGYPVGYQVLCMNCNTIKKMKNKEDRPWNKKELENNEGNYVAS